MRAWGCADDGGRHKPRALALAVAVGAALVLVACEPASPPAPPVVAPTTPAPAGTYRAQAEQWVAGTLFPALLDRAGGGASARSWADRLVRSTPQQVVLTLAATPEARRRVASSAYEQALDRAPSRAEAGNLLSRLEADRFDALVAELFASSELTNRIRSDSAFIGWLYQRVLGRDPDAAGRDRLVSQLAGTATRVEVAVSLLRSGEAHRLAVTKVYEDLTGATPSAAALASGIRLLQASGGDPARVRAALATALAPTGYRVGVVGDSLGFDLAYRVAGLRLPAVVSAGGQNPRSGAAIACGVLSATAGYRWKVDGTWKALRNGTCPAQIASYQRTLLTHGPEVVLWTIGALEATEVMRPNGSVIAAQSAAMRAELTAEIVRRVDQLVAGGVRWVVFPQWACVGNRAPGSYHTAAYSRFVGSVLREVQVLRPAAASVMPTPPQVCVDGDPTGLPTREHRAARADEFHWVGGNGGAAWGWTYWFAPAIADLPGRTP